VSVCQEHGIEHYVGDPGLHTHDDVAYERKPCRACFRDYIERNHGLPTAPMDLPNAEERIAIEREGIRDRNPSLTALIRDKS
jgi:hypothetical protein